MSFPGVSTEFQLMCSAKFTDIFPVYGPEILPLEARTRGTAISVSAHWLWNFFIVMISVSVLAFSDYTFRLETDESPCSPF